MARAAARAGGPASATDLARTAAERDAARSEVERLRGERDAWAERLRTTQAGLAASQAVLESERAAARERLELLRTEQERLVEQFTALSADALRHNNEAFLTLADERFKAAQQAQAGELEQRKVAVETLVAPLKDTLGKVEGQLRELETARVAAYTSLTEQVRFVQATSEQLRSQTSALVTALSAPQARGRWGEMQLRRVVELAGMIEHVDFEEQVSAVTATGTVRPDLVVRMAGGKNIVVDAKVTLAAYLDAAETADAAERTNRLAAHARHLRKHVDDLAGKQYWAHFSPAPELVVLFVPGEAFLAPALEHEPDLLEHAMQRRVMIATPTTLMVLLRSVAYGWQQDALTDNARAVFELGRELYDRLGRLGEYVDKLGRSISRVVGDYNTAVGSLETRVLVTARKLAELKIVDSSIDSPRVVDDATRTLTAAPLLAAAADGRSVRALPVQARLTGLDDDEDEDDEIVIDPRYGIEAAVESGLGDSASRRATGEGA
jgi:DNA recombination protein RmuC